MQEKKMIHENIFQSPLSTHSFVNKYVAELKALKPTQEAKTKV